MTAWEITVTCRCHDPVVFGHIMCRGETQPWTQPPLHTYATGETFTVRGGIIMPACEAAHAIRELTQTLHNLHRATTTGWNWAELAETARNRPEPRRNDETCP